MCQVQLEGVIRKDCSTLGNNRAGKDADCNPFSHHTRMTCLVVHRVSSFFHLRWGNPLRSVCFNSFLGLLQFEFSLQLTQRLFRIHQEFRERSTRIVVHPKKYLDCRTHGKKQEAGEGIIFCCPWPCCSKALMFHDQYWSTTNHNLPMYQRRHPMEAIPQTSTQWKWLSLPFPASNSKGHHMKFARCLATSHARAGLSCFDQLIWPVTFCSEASSPTVLPVMTPIFFTTNALLASKTSIA